MRNTNLLLVIVNICTLTFLAGCSKDPAGATGITGTWALASTREVDRTNNIVTYDSTFQQPAGGTILTFTSAGYAYYGGYAVYTDTTRYTLIGSALTFHPLMDTNSLTIDTILTLNAHSLVFSETDAQGVTNIKHITSYTR